MLIYLILILGVEGKMLNTLMMNIAESSYKLKENPAKWLKVRENASG